MCGSRPESEIVSIRARGKWVVIAWRHLSPARSVTFPRPRKKRLAVKPLTRAQRIFLHRRQRRGDHRQVDHPKRHPPPSVPRSSICRDEFPHRPIIHPRLKPQFRLRARLQVDQIQLVHRRKFSPMRRPEQLLGRDVHDDLTATRAGYRQASTIAVFPPILWPISVTCASPRIHPRYDIIRHRRIAHFVRMRRTPVIPQIQRQNVVIGRQLLARRLPIARRTQQPVQNHEGVFPARPNHDEIE